MFWARLAIKVAEKQRAVPSLLRQVTQHEYYQHKLKIQEERHRSCKSSMHTYIFFLMTMLGLLLQLKSSEGVGTASLFVTNYNNLLTFIVALNVYIGTLFAVNTLRAAQSNFSELAAEFINNISILLGILASIILLLMLVPAPIQTRTIFIV